MSIIKSKVRLIKEILKIKEVDSSQIQMAKCMSGLSWFIKDIKQDDMSEVIAHTYALSNYLEPLHYNINIINEKKEISSLKFRWLLDKNIEEQPENTIDYIYSFVNRIKTEHIL